MCLTRHSKQYLYPDPNYTGSNASLIQFKYFSVIQCEILAPKLIQNFGLRVKKQCVSEIILSLFIILLNVFANSILIVIFIFVYKLKRFVTFLDRQKSYAQSWYGTKGTK